MKSVITCSNLLPSIIAVRNKICPSCPHSCDTSIDRGRTCVASVKAISWASFSSSFVHVTSSIKLRGWHSWFLLCYMNEAQSHAALSWNLWGLCPLTCMPGVGLYLSLLGVSFSVTVIFLDRGAGVFWSKTTFRFVCVWVCLVKVNVPTCKKWKLGSKNCLLCLFVLYT